MLKMLREGTYARLPGYASGAGLATPRGQESVSQPLFFGLPGATPGTWLVIASERSQTESVERFIAAREIHISGGPQRVDWELPAPLRDATLFVRLNAIDGVLETSCRLELWGSYESAASKPNSARIELTPSRYHRTSDSNGLFALPTPEVPANAVDLRWSLTVFPSLHPPSTTPILGKLPTEITVTLEAGASLQVTVKNLDLMPDSGGRVSCQLSFEPESPGVRSSKKWTIFTTQFTAPSAALTNLSPGRYRLALNLPYGNNSNAVQLRLGTVDLAPGANVAEFTAPTLSTIILTAPEAEPSARITISTLPGRPESERNATVTVQANLDALGRATFPYLPPGTYRASWDSANKHGETTFSVPGPQQLEVPVAMK